MNTLDQWSALVGFALPLVVAVIQREKWRSSIRTAVGVAACAVAAVGTAYFQNKLTLHNWESSVVVIFLMTKTSYLAVWKPTGIAPAVESTTSGTRRLSISLVTKDNTPPAQ